MQLVLCNHYDHNIDGHSKIPIVKNVILFWFGAGVVQWLRS